MKLFLLILALALVITCSNAQQPEPGIYRGYITVTRSNAALQLRDVATLLIVGELRHYDLSESRFFWTARNWDQGSRLQNLWLEMPLIYSTLPERVPDVGTWGGANFSLPGGTTVPGSFKMTTKSLAWKCIKEYNAPYARNVIITTSFSITRSGSSPPPDAQP